MTKPETVTSDINATLGQRGKRYGVFADQARYAQRLKAIFQSSPNWDQMDDDQREALDMLANKVARILNGDYNYADSWHDIAGYIKLVDDRLTEELNTNMPNLSALLDYGDLSLLSERGLD